MKHSIDDLIETVHRHYTRGMSHEDPRRKHTEEYHRLSAARRQAGVDNEPWRALLRRLHVQFPGCIQNNRSLHLPTGEFDAGYSGELFLPEAPGEHPRTVGFLVSFLVPYYLVYSTRTVDDVAREPPPDAAKSLSFYFGSTMYVLPARWWSRLLAKGAGALSRLDDLRRPRPDAAAQARAEERKNRPPTRRDIHLDLSPEEQSYATWLAREIEATWGCARMPPEVGNVIVPDVATNHRRLGEARLYDCLLSDDW